MASVYTYSVVTVHFIVSATDCCDALQDHIRSLNFREVVLYGE